LKQRIEFLDLWRSLCLLIMAAFHFCFDLMLFGVVPERVMTSLPARVLAYDVGGCFVLLSGICVRFSRNPLRRGFFVFCVGAVVTVVTVLLGMQIAFGVLQLLGVCMMLYAPLRSRLEQCIGWPFAACCLALFAATWLLTSRISVDITLLYPIGLTTDAFYSADYWPFFPWVFVFLIGTVFGKKLEETPECPLWNRHFPAWMTFLGRHSLPVYLIHQPILYGACWLLLHE